MDSLGGQKNLKQSTNTTPSDALELSHKAHLILIGRAWHKALKAEPDEALPSPQTDPGQAPKAFQADRTH